MSETSSSVNTYKKIKRNCLFKANLTKPFPAFGLSDYQLSLA